MGRKKTSEVPELKLGSEDTQVINASDIEAAEAELLNDAVDESEDKLETKAEETESKPKRQRKPRKTAAVAESATQELTADLGLQKEVEIARETVQVTMSTMLTQFNAVKDITNGLNANLEKMTTLIREMSPNQSTSLEELVKPPVNQAFISKFATAASLVAVLLSVLSLSMSQSARQVALNNESNRVAQSAAALSAIPTNYENKAEMAFAPSENLSKRSGNAGSKNRPQGAGHSRK